MNFNVRVYSFLENMGKMLILKEPFLGELVNKLPGGGLEFGEGTRACLVREFKEELNLEVEVKEHIYTLDYFIDSKRKKQEQFIFIYYKVEAKDISTLKVLVPEIQELIWIDKHEIKESDLTLESDRIALSHFLKK